MAAPPADRSLAPVCIALAPDQIHWLDHHARNLRISRSAAIRQAVDALMRQQQRRAANGL